MADDRRGEPPLGPSGADSPWAHDVPIGPAPPLPDAWTRPAETDADLHSAHHIDHHIDHHADRLTGHVEPIVAVPAPIAVGSTPDPSVAGAHRQRRGVVVAGVVGILIAATIGAQFIGGGQDDNQNGDNQSGDNQDAGRGGTEAGRDSVEDAGGIAPSSTAPRSTDPSSVPIDPGPSTLFPATPRAATPATTVSDSLPEPERAWVSSPIALSPRLQAMMVPTQVVVLNTDGILHVIDVPAGMLRTIDTRVNGTSLAVVVGDEAIAVSSPGSARITVVNPDGAVYDVNVPGGAGQMLARSGTNDFVVTPNEWSNSRQPTDILISADGTTREIEDGPLREYGVWGVRYLKATGEAVVNDSSGTYAIDASGAARRMSIGDLVAIGENHVLVRECDEALHCVHTRIDGRSGERIQVSASDLEGYRGFDSSLSLSPDGSQMTYFDWMGAPLARRLLDLTAGTSVIVDSIDQYGNNTAWAADSSGIFIIDNRQLVLHDNASGDRIDVAPGVDLGAIVAVAAR